jgi:hypothetical protein
MYSGHVSLCISDPSGPDAFRGQVTCGERRGEAAEEKARGRSGAGCEKSGDECSDEALPGQQAGSSVAPAGFNQ